MKDPDGDVARTSIESLGLKPKQVFGYRFDFGDNWLHQINVVAIEARGTPGEYPKVTKCVGESPPQYVDWDDKE